MKIKFINKETGKEFASDEQYVPLSDGNGNVHLLDNSNRFYPSWSQIKSLKADFCPDEPKIKLRSFDEEPEKQAYIEVVAGDGMPCTFWYGYSGIQYENKIMFTEWVQLVAYADTAIGWLYAYEQAEINRQYFELERIEDE